jgi:hypothetical protein
MFVIFIFQLFNYHQYGRSGRSCNTTVRMIDYATHTTTDRSTSLDLYLIFPTTFIPHCKVTFFLLF